WGRAHWDELDDDCHNRIDRNPLRLLDCKRDAKVTESAPKSLDDLCDECRTHFETVKELLSAASVEYVVNPRMVRGLDYYTRTAFEVMAGGLGAQSTVVAGGRYDGLVETMGGASIAGIGFAIGVDRMALALEAAGGAQPKKPAVVIVPLGKAMTPQANVVAQEFRSAGLDTELFSPERKLKALLGRASKIGSEFVVIVGEDENARGVVQLRDLKQSGQQAVTLQEAIESVRNSAKK
ncbi:histidine--tRNA ligase, partial [Candidatus Binatus sp.]|uniref:histidine--tRNA ligase n=1 Tax=Candidatus Binatus sp. TaxID=2811406 RepID=UPI003CC54DE9